MQGVFDTSPHYVNSNTLCIILFLSKFKGHVYKRKCEQTRIVSELFDIS